MTLATDGPTIRRAQAAEAARLGSLIAGEFHHLDVSSWLVQDPLERKLAMAGQFEILIGHAIEHGDVFTVDSPDGGPAAVAAWFRPGEIPEIEDYDERLAVACGTHTAQFAKLDDTMHAAHPDGPPHAYLAFLAVSSEVQGKGVGSALLRTYHERLDADGTPAYLEASGLQSRRLYLRHGYVDHGAPYGVDGGQHFWPMWRA